MANHILKYTGEEVDQLLEKIDTAFGETTTYGDTLTWDGSTDGLYNPSGSAFYLVSDALPTYEEIKGNGSVSVMISGNAMTLDLSMITGSGMIADGTIGKEYVMLPEGCGFVIYQENVTWGGITFERPGIYFGNTVGVGYIQSLTINGYTGFETTEVKTIDPKYIVSRKTYFYVIDGTMYTDEAGTIKVKPVDVKNAYDNGQVVIKKDDWEYIASEFKFSLYPNAVFIAVGLDTYSIT